MLPKRELEKHCALPENFFEKNSFQSSIKNISFFSLGARYASISQIFAKTILNALRALRQLLFAQLKASTFHHRISKSF
jgi:hypothetical protein